MTHCVHILTNHQARAHINEYRVGCYKHLKKVFVVRQILFGTFCTKKCPFLGALAYAVMKIENFRPHFTSLVE
jgi:hypothetical protein